MLVACCLLCSACASVRVPGMGSDLAGTDVVLVRHAETSHGADPDDPPLSAAGQARAQALAGMLATAPLRAVYVTEFQRTQQTGAPAAHAHGLVEQHYFSRGPADDQARQWRAAWHGGTVLVIGDAGAIHDLAAALCACPLAPTGTEAGSLLRIHLAADGQAQVSSTRGAAPAPPATTPTTTTTP